jgi:hypothetical protein
MLDIGLWSGDHRPYGAVRPTFSASNTNRTIEATRIFRMTCAGCALIVSSLIPRISAITRMHGGGRPPFFLLDTGAGYRYGTAFESTAG